MKNKSASTEEFSIVSVGTSLKGDLVSNGNIRIDGTVEGNITSAASIVVGSTGKITGEVKGYTINIGGEIVGSVICKEKLILEVNSKLIGDLITKSLVVQEGAVFEGRSKMVNNNVD